MEKSKSSPLPMEMTESLFERSRQLLGHEAMGRIATARVIVFGVGGVGSWCAESLVRTGIRRLTIVDFDKVAPSNVNRQLMATTETIGQPKVKVLRQRLLAINPDAEITAIDKAYTPETASEFRIHEYDFVIDAIDSLPDKAHLILEATGGLTRGQPLQEAALPIVGADLVSARKGPVLFSSMGAALKLDPTQISVAEFWKVQGCPLARALRNRFKKNGAKPGKKFLCVYSPERVPSPEGKGSLVHITAIFGNILASLVINHLK